MSIYKDLKKAVSFTVDVVVEKTASQAQKSRLLTVMKTEAKNIDRLYIELGQYLYANLRDSMPENIAHSCDLIDESKARMSRAQEKYREVIRQDLVNKEINRAEAKENFVRIKEPIVAKAKDTAVLVKDKAVDTASKVKTDTAVKVEGLKKAVAERKANRQKAEATESPEEPRDNAEEICDSIIEVKEEADVNAAIKEAVSETENACADDTCITAEKPSEPAAEPGFPVEMTTEAPLDSKTVAEAAEEADDPTMDNKPFDQEFQRNVPVDIISETEFEEDEPEVKPIEKSNPIAKAMKLRKIISKKENSEE